MSVALWLLALQGVLGAADTAYYHEWRARLPARPETTSSSSPGTGLQRSGEVVSVTFWGGAPASPRASTTLGSSGSLKNAMSAARSLRLGTLASIFATSAALRSARRNVCCQLGEGICAAFGGPPQHRKPMSALFVSGRTPRPFGVLAVQSGTGAIRYWHAAASTATLTPPRVDMMRSLLRSAVAAGTGRRANVAPGIMGKTGTAQDDRSALFVGLTDSQVATFWFARGPAAAVRVESPLATGAYARFYKNLNDQ